MATLVAMAVLGLAALLSGCATTPRAPAPEPEVSPTAPPEAPPVENLRGRGEPRLVRPRWETNEIPYAEAKLYDKMGRNVRDGITEFIDSYIQGAVSLQLTLGRTGYISSKIMLVVGDVVGLIDDNAITEHVFKGIVSRQFLRFASTAQGYQRALGGVHNAPFDGIPRTAEDYIGDRAFHVRGYGGSSGLVTLGAILAGDFIIRPAGHFITIFQARSAGQTLNQAGLDLIDGALDVNFF